MGQELSQSSQLQDFLEKKPVGFTFDAAVMADFFPEATSGSISGYLSKAVQTGALNRDHHNYIVVDMSLYNARLISSPGSPPGRTLARGERAKPDVLEEKTGQLVLELPPPNSVRAILERLNRQVNGTIDDTLLDFAVKIKDMVDVSMSEIRDLPIDLSVVSVDDLLAEVKSRMTPK